MDVRMKHKGLAPGVKHAERTDLRSQAAACDVGESRSNGAEEQIVEDPRGMKCENVELLGHGEDHMEVRYREKLGRTSIEPRATCRSLTARAGAIAARVPLDVLVPTMVTLLASPAQGGRTAGADRA